MTLIDWDDPTHQDVQLSKEIRQQHEWDQKVGVPRTSEGGAILALATSLEHVTGMLNFWYASEEAEGDHRPGLLVNDTTRSENKTEFFDESSKTAIR